MRYLLSLFKFQSRKTPFYYNWEQSQFEKQIQAQRENARPTFIGSWDRL